MLASLTMKKLVVGAQGTCNNVRGAQKEPVCLQLDGAVIYTHEPYIVSFKNMSGNPS